jgi:hypothetical protein
LRMNTGVASVLINCDSCMWFKVPSEEDIYTTVAYGICGYNNGIEMIFCTTLWNCAAGYEVCGGIVYCRPRCYHAFY